MGFTVSLVQYPTDEDWMLCKRCALVTMGKKPITPPNEKWKHDSLKARHSHIRVLPFMFSLEGIPYFVSVHLCRHVHSQPFVKSQRSNPDRGAERQDAPVDMLWMMNAEELMNVASKRLCSLADPMTQSVVREMCQQVEQTCPEFEGLLAPMCAYEVCREMFSCGNPHRCSCCKYSNLKTDYYNFGLRLECRRTWDDVDGEDVCAFFEREE